MSAPILVATDGTEGAIGAIRLARKLEARDGRPVEIVGVVEPLPVYDAGFTVSLPEAELLETRQETLRRLIEDQVEEVRGSRSAWPIHVEVGLPGPRIAERAEAGGMEAILLGLGQHRPLDRILGTETALRVIRLARVPVLAVPPAWTDLPRVAVLAIDFSAFSTRAARTALPFLKSPAHVHLVHVVADVDLLPGLPEGFEREYGKQVDERLGRTARDLHLPEGWSSDTHALEGEAARRILDLADEVGAELLVAGSHGHSFIGRLLVGSVSTRLVRAAACPVLVTPPAPEKVEDEREERAHGWVETLSEFTVRNSGRRTTLEVDHPELGAQHSGTNFPLFGVDYDPRRDRIDIMLGRQGTVEGHLTHSFSSPREIEVLRSEGEDEALRIELARGQVLLRIHR